MNTYSIFTTAYNSAAEKPRQDMERCYTLKLQKAWIHSQEGTRGGWMMAQQLRAPVALAKGSAPTQWSITILNSNFRGFESLF